MNKWNKIEIKLIQRYENKVKNIRKSIMLRVKNVWVKNMLGSCLL